MKEGSLEIPERCINAGVTPCTNAGRCAMKHRVWVTCLPGGQSEGGYQKDTVLTDDRGHGGPKEGARRTARPVGCTISTVNRRTTREEVLLCGVQVAAIAKALHHGDSGGGVTRGGRRD